MPGNITVSSADMYSLYLKEHSGAVLPKRTIGHLVQKLFDKVKVVHQNGPSKFKGRRQRFDIPELCTESTVQATAAKYGFVRMTEAKADGPTYICYSGYIVNNKNKSNPYKFPVKTLCQYLLVKPKYHSLT